MNDEQNPPNDESNSEYGDGYSPSEGIGAGFARGLKRQDPKPDEHDPGKRPKPPILARVWITMWRRRRLWRKMAGHTPPNWAERTTVLFTGAIVIITGIQAYIYWKQAGLMRASIEQNERSITLNRGQLAVANRAAKSAEDSAKLSKQIIAGTEGAVLEDTAYYQPQPTGPPVFILNIRNEGKSISPHVTGTLTVSRKTLPALKTIDSRPFTVDMVQLANDGGPNRFSNGKSQTFQVPGFNADAVLKLRETVRVEGTYDYDDGFGRMVPKSVCYQLKAILNPQACAYQAAVFMWCSEIQYQTSLMESNAKNCQQAVR
jgi:hypothetical protein